MMWLSFRLRTVGINPNRLRSKNPDVLSALRADDLPGPAEFESDTSTAAHETMIWWRQSSVNRKTGVSRMTKNVAVLALVLGLFAAISGIGSVSATGPATPTAVSTSTLSIGTGQTAFGDTVSIDVVVDQLETGLTGFDLVVEVVDPTTAVITGVDFNSNFQMTSVNIEVDGSSARIIGVDLGIPGMVGSGATNVNLATLQIRGLVEGVSTIQSVLNNMDDDDGTSIPAVLVSGSIEVLNSSPSVNAGPNAAVALGDTFVGTGSISDPGDNIWTGTVDYGDGTVGPLTDIVGATFTLNHDYQLTGLHTVTVTIFDDDGAIGIDTMQVDVTKVYPTLPGLIEPAQDLDGDGLAEDVNGNGRLDFDDIVKLFKNVSSTEVTDNSDDFDFNGNGTVDMDDIVKLFMMLVSKFG